jgi:hypothetical protein
MKKKRLFVCRWPNGDFSVVYAEDEDMAIMNLDAESPGAEEATYIPIDDFIAHFRLTDDGEFKLQSIDPDTEVVIREAAYPFIVEAILASDSLEGPSREQIRSAAEKERLRVRPRVVPQPDTEIGKRIKQETDLPTGLVNRMVESYSKKALKKVKVKGRPIH